MIILITATPGSGKTLYATTLIQKALKEELPEKEGEYRPVFSDINGLNIPGVGKAPEDWRETPDGSFVVYDEVQDHMGTSLPRNLPERITELAKHRHTGHDIVLITQGPKLLNSFVRPLVGRHIHLERVMGSTNAKVFTAERCMDNVSRSELSKADQTLWSYPKKNFDLYKSSTVHTHKTKLPAWFVRTMIFMAVLISGAAYAFSNTSFFTGGIAETEKQVTQTVQPTLTPQYSAVKTTLEPKKPEIEEVETVPVACIATSKHCRCYDNTNRLMSLSMGECKTFIESALLPLPNTARTHGVRRVSSRDRSYL